MQRNQRKTRFLAGAIGAAVASLLLTTMLQGQQRSASQRVLVKSPDRTDAGDWSGTWYFQTRSQKWALWLRANDGVPEMRFQYQNKERAENFKTDWDSVAHYVNRDRKGTFELGFTRRDANLVHADWYWKLGTAGEDSVVRTETAKIRVYRAGAGRQLVVRFDDYERLYTGRDEARMATDQAWTFLKASRRHVGWNELPF